jgi:hypothetical protein
MVLRGGATGVVRAVTTTTGAVNSQPAVSPWDRRRDRRALLLVFLLVWGVYLATASYTLNQVNDSRETALAAWSLGVRGTPASPVVWPEDLLRWEMQGRDGQRYTNRFPGPILWGAPFYAVTELASTRGTPPHPWLANFAPAGAAAATAAALAIAACFAVFRRLTERPLAVGGALTLGFATGMWSVAGDALWTHGPAALALALGMLAMSSRRYAAGGLAFAAAILCRPHLAFVPAVVGLWEGLARRRLKPIVVIGATSLMGVVAMSLYSQMLFGTWLPMSGYSSSRVDALVTTGGSDFLERTAFMFVHPLRGLFIYTPILLILLPGIARAWRVAPDWVRSASVGGLVYLVVQLRVNTWHGGGDYFGNRLALETLVLASPLLVLTFREFVLRSSRLIAGLFGVLLLASVTWHALGATVLESGVYGYDGVTYWQEVVADLCEDEPSLCET